MLQSDISVHNTHTFQAVFIQVDNNIDDLHLYGVYISDISMVEVMGTILNFCSKDAF